MLTKPADWFSEKVKTTLSKLTYLTWNYEEMNIKHTKWKYKYLLPILNKKYLYHYKITINWESLIQFIQVLYTKVSRFHRLTTPPNLQFCLSSSKKRTAHLSSSDNNMQWLCTKVYATKVTDCMIEEWSIMPSSLVFHKACSYSKRRIKCNLYN